MPVLARVAAAAIVLSWSTAIAAAADRTIVILDASGSMWGQIEGKPKQEIARQSLRGVLQSLPADREIGFMAYGHRDKASCKDIELIVPPAAGTAGAITSAADNLKFLGKTPLVAAVRQAAEALRYTEGPSRVVVITDGMESCGGDPCALGKELKAAGAGFVADVVGFGLNANEGREVACLAEATGGKYIQASDEKALREALLATVAAPTPAAQPAAAGTTPAPPAPPAPQAPAEAPKAGINFLPVVTLTQGGAPVKDSNIWEIYKANADGSRGSYLDTQYGDYAGTLAPGAYVVVARLGEARAEQKVTVVAGETYRPAFVLNAGTLRIHPRPSAGAEVDAVAHVEVTYPGDRATTYGDATLILPAGEQTVTVSIGSGKKTETVQLAAGQTVDKDIIVGVGRATLNAYYAEGGDKVDGNAVSFRIVKAEKKADGSREDVERAYGAGAKFDLPPADYVAIATADLASAEQPFTVKVGEANNIKINLNAGILVVSAPGADTTELFARDAQGNRKSLGLDYGDKRQEAVPAGDYVVVRNLPDDGGSKEMPVTVKPGGRTEITVQ